MYFGVLWCFVWRTNSSEIFHFPEVGLLVKAFRIPSDAFLQRCINKDLHKTTRAGQSTCKFAIRPEWRDERDEHNESCVGHQSGNMRNPAHILYTILNCKSKIFVEAMLILSPSSK